MSSFRSKTALRNPMRKTPQFQFIHRHIIRVLTKTSLSSEQAIKPAHIMIIAKNFLIILNFNIEITQLLFP